MDLLRAAQNNTPKPKVSLKRKLIALFSNIRGFNILLLVSAQVLASIFIFASETPWTEVLKDINLLIIVISTLCVVAAGYIINNFYDYEADLIHRPYKTSLEDSLDQSTKLRLYFFLNCMGFGAAFLISWRAALFFACYIFFIWLYSHKLKSYPIMGFISAAVLQMLPFFVIFIYFRNFSTIIFAHASFLFFMVLMKELIKGLEKSDGDEVLNKSSLAVVYGDRFAKVLFSLLTLLMISPLYYLLNIEPIGDMKYYFYLAYMSLIGLNIVLWSTHNTAWYLHIHNVIRLLLFLGVFSICLLN